MNEKYALALALYLVIIVADLCFNTATTILFKDTTAQLTLFILQDTLIVMSIITTAIMFSSTYVFQAGLISILLRKFSIAILTLFTYFILSILLHIYSLRKRWEQDKGYEWSGTVTVLYVIQRSVAVFHYFLYKRTILYLSDPKFHFDSDWLREMIRQRG